MFYCICSARAQKSHIYNPGLCVYGKVGVHTIPTLRKISPRNIYVYIEILVMCLCQFVRWQFFFFIILMKSYQIPVTLISHGDVGSIVTVECNKRKHLNNLKHNGFCCKTNKQKKKNLTIFQRSSTLF